MARIVRRKFPADGNGETENETVRGMSWQRYYDNFCHRRARTLIGRESAAVGRISATRESVMRFWGRETAVAPAVLFAAVRRVGRGHALRLRTASIGATWGGAPTSRGKCFAGKCVGGAGPPRSRGLVAGDSR